MDNLTNAPKQKELLKRLAELYRTSYSEYYAPCREIARLLKEPRRNFELTKLWENQMLSGWFDEATETALLLPEPQRTTYLSIILERELTHNNIKQARILAEILGIRLSQKQLINAVMRADPYLITLDFIRDTLKDLTEKRRQQFYSSLVRKHVNEGNYSAANTIAQRLQGRDLTGAELKQFKIASIESGKLISAINFASMYGAQLTAKELRKIIDAIVKNLSRTNQEGVGELLKAIDMLCSTTALEFRAHTRRVCKPKK